jgi:hypothetical protein
MHLQRVEIWVSGIRIKTVLAAMMFAAIGFEAPASAQLPPVHMQGSTEYLSGGFGLDESTAIKQAMGQFQLALTFASHADGKAAYAGDVQVVIRDENDANVLNVASEGPFLLVKLHPGNYQVFATYQGETQSRKVATNASGTKQLTFQWNRPASGPD